jgi:SSS family solute:Na+ symporter
MLDAFRQAHPSFSFLTFMVISFILAVVCGLILVVMSLAFPEPLTEEKRKLVWKSPLEPLHEKGWPGLGNYKLLSGILALTMIALYVIFTFFVN